MQDLLAPSKTAKGKNGFQILMDALPDTHKARWFAGAALNSAEQAMASVMSTVLSRLNAFLDSELEQVLCFDSAIDAELFAARKSAIFLVLPEEDPSKNFMAGLMIQTLSRELFSVADENGGKLPNRVVLFCDELGTMPAFDILPLFSAGRSRNTNKITDYGDAYGHWAYEALAWAVDNGVLVGTSEDRLNPDGYLTRAQMAAMIDRLFGAYKSADISRFTDVPRGSWHHDYIAQAVHMGTFAGYSSSRMGPEDNITREQAMVVLARTVCLPSAGNSALARFPDRNQVGAWAADAVAAMVERGYVSGYNDGRLNPKGQITRAEMAQIMSNIFQRVHDSGDLTGTYRDTVLVRGAVNIKDAVFESDLILANGLGEKALDLNNITVKGRLVVWGGSAVNITGKSTVAGVVTPRNDGPVQVVFDAAAARLSEKDCAIVYPSGMDEGNKVLFTDKADKPAIAFDLPAYRYVGDSVSVKTTLTGAEAVTWELTRDGKSAAMPEGFTKDGGICFFMEAGRYTLKGTVENSGGTAFCEKTVEVLPIGDIAFSLPEYGYTDRAEDVKLLLKNDLDGSVVWTLMKDGANQPLASFTKEGGTLALARTGKYTLTATLTDAAGKQYTASQSITILPVIVPTVTVSADRAHEDDTVEIGLTVEGGKPDSVRWALTRDGKEAAASLGDQGGTLTFNGAGDYTLTAIARDAHGREFPSEPVAIKVIPNLSLSLTADTDKLHKDEAAAISLTVEHGTPSTVQWALTHDGEGVPVSLDDNGGKLDSNTGFLSNDGGMLALFSEGTYTITATVRDDAGNLTSGFTNITIPPLLSAPPGRTPPLVRSSPPSTPMTVRPSPLWRTFPPDAPKWCRLSPAPTAPLTVPLLSRPPIPAFTMSRSATPCRAAMRNCSRSILTRLLGRRRTAS